MKPFERPSKEEPPKKDRRKDGAERLRRQREIDEIRHRRFQPLCPDPRLFGF
jgi:hypothetical protein